MAIIVEIANSSMISKESHTIEWITQVSKANRNADKILVEKVIKALQLLEQLRQKGLNFIFKGGTSLMLLAPQPKRLSIDIDIVLPEKPENIDNIFGAITQDGGFSGFKAHERVAKSKIDKAHYKFYYQPVIGTRTKEEYILLDILYESNPYGNLVHDVAISSSFLKRSETQMKVSMPTYEAILGDKLTAFAPNTTGVPYGRGKEIDIIKQLYDIGYLFDMAENVSHVKQVFETIAKKELEYREMDLPVNNILDDIYETSLCIATRGKDGKGDFTELQTGIRNIVSYIFSVSTIQMERFLN